MTSLSLARRGSLVVLLALAAPSVGAGQVRRAALLDSAQALIDDFNERQSVRLLQRALDPALGAPDSSWSHGVQLLAQVLLRNNQRDEAQSWLRWALRLAPRMQVDSVTFVPAVVSAFHAARQYVEQSPRDARAQFRFEWSTATAAGGSGDLRVEHVPADQSAQWQVAVEGAGFLDPGRPRRLAPGSYRVTARAVGAPNADLVAEVLPGVTTVITLRFATAVATLDERRVAALLARIDATRLGDRSCAVAGLVSNSGLLVTSYRAIRGADALAVTLPNAQFSDNRIRVAAHDVTGDLAVLSIGGSNNDSLTVATEIGTLAALWTARFPACGRDALIEKVVVENVGRDAIRLSGSSGGLEQSPVLLTTTGALAGIVVTDSTARPLAPVTGLLATARRNLASGSLLSASQVASREQHTLGSVRLVSNEAGTRARVTPRERWHWAELARTEALPFTYRGPMGRYLVEVLQGEEVKSRREITIEPSSSKQVALGVVASQPARKGRSLTLPIIGGLAAGGLVAVLMGGGGGEKATTGTIRIQLP